MNFEFIVSVIIFLVLAIFTVCWQPARLILKEVFSRPLEDSEIRAVSNEKGGEKRMSAPLSGA